MALDTVAKLSKKPWLTRGTGGNGYNGGPYQWYTGNVGGVATSFTTNRTICTPANSMFTNYAAIDAAAGDTYLTEFLHAGNASVLHQYYLADLLVAAGGFSGSLTTLQTFATPPDVSVGTNNMAVRRGASDYSDVWWFLTIQSELGSAARLVAMTYTDASGTSGLTYSPGNLGGGEVEARMPRRVLPFNPPGGVRSIEGGQLVLSTGTAGNWGVMAVRPLMHLTASRQSRIETRWPSCLVKMPAEACPILMGDYSGNGVSGCSQIHYAKWVKA
jgi:hypothetical protein